MWFVFQGVPSPACFGYESWDDEPAGSVLRNAVLFSHSVEALEDVQLDLGSIVTRAREDTGGEFSELAIDNVQVTEGSILVTIAIGSVVIQTGPAGITAAGIAAWVLMKMGGGALQRFGERLGDRAFEAMPEKLRGKRRDARAEAAAVVSRLAEERGCQGAVLVVGGLRVNNGIKYRCKFIPSGCGARSATILIPSQNEMEPTITVYD